MAYIIDLAGVRSAEELHRRIRECLPCPEWYGNNLDALHDLLTSQGGEWQVTFLHPAELEETLPVYAASLRRLCRHAAAETPGLTVEFGE